MSGNRTVDKLIEDFSKDPDRLLFYSDIQEVIDDTGNKLIKLLNRISYLNKAIEQYEEREQNSLATIRELEAKIWRLAEEKRLLELREIELLRRLEFKPYYS